MPAMRGAKPRLANAELALAMELRDSGMTWKIIAYGLGVTTEHLINRVARAKREGYREIPEFGLGLP